MAVKRLKYGVNGEWKESATKKYMPITDSNTGKVIAEAPCCTAEEVNEAVAAARAAGQRRRSACGCRLCFVIRPFWMLIWKN